MKAAVIVALSLLASCATTKPIITSTDGAGFSKGHPSDEMRAAMINVQPDFYRWYRGHEETCDASAACEK